MNVTLSQTSEDTFSLDRAHIVFHTTMCELHHDENLFMIYNVISKEADISLPICADFFVSYIFNTYTITGVSRLQLASTAEQSNFILNSPKTDFLMIWFSILLCTVQSGNIAHIRLLMVVRDICNSLTR